MGFVQRVEPTVLQVCLLVNCKQVDDACTIKMDANRQITATWVQSTKITTLSVDVNGSGRVTGARASK